MSAAVMKEVADFREKIKHDAEALVLKKFPENMLELDKLLLNDKFQLDSLDSVHYDVNIPVPDAAIYNNHSGDQGTKKRKFSEVAFDTEIVGTKVLVLPNGTAPANKLLSELIQMVKPKMKQLIEDANLLKMWILFLIPRIEDGNNFGVSIQEDTLSEIRTVESEAAAYFDQISRYYMSRGKIVAKIAKYPHVEDFRNTLNEIDEKEYMSIRLVVCELRNHYATLHDLITKNLEKIKKPRSSNNETMY
ncbi:Proteasome activator complex subunit 3 [Halotydeus destructor]|nr:Proteasome activator complex subunit 3 [Halotydeus destructor]